jgi:uncharacterized protein YbjT (DUF2867 family)
MGGKRVVVCGATGNQGRAVVRCLLESGRWTVAGLSRSPEGDSARELERRGVEVVRGDLLDRGSLVGAFQGAHGVFGVTQPWSPDYKTCDTAGEIQQGKNIVDACLEAGVEHLVLSTVALLGGGRMGVPHVDSKVDVEDYARTRQVPMTVIRPGCFMDNIGSPFFPVKRGRVRGFVDRDAKVPFVACADIGRLAAVAFDRPAELRGKVVTAVGDLVSGDEIAATLSRLRGGERFRYHAPPAALMWLFAREFYLMRRVFERYGRPPYPPEYAAAVEETRSRCRGGTTMERFLEGQGYAMRRLA